MTAMKQWGQKMVDSGWIRAAVVLGLMSMIGPFAMDMYLPAMPQIAADLGTNARGMQATIALYLAAFGLGQLVYGPWADQAGRKLPLYVGLAIFGLGSVIALTAQGIAILSLGRVVQGLGAASVMVVPRAIIRDIARGDQATRLMAMMMLVFSVSPMLAPVTGAGLMALFGWRAVFWALALTTLVCLYLLHVHQPETLDPALRQRFSWAVLARGARRLAVDRRFVVLTLLGTAGMTSFFVFLAAAPFVYTRHFGLSPQQFSLAFAANAVAFIAVGQMAGPLGARFGAVAVMRGAALVFLLATAGLFALGNGAGLVAFIGLLMLGNAGLGLIIPTSMVLALEDQGEIAGLASSLGGTFQMIAGGAVVALAGPILGAEPAAMTGMIAACAVVTAALTWR